MKNIISALKRPLANICNLKVTIYTNSKRDNRIHTVTFVFVVSYNGTHQFVMRPVLYFLQTLLPAKEAFLLKNFSYNGIRAKKLSVSENQKDDSDEAEK